MFRSIVHQIPDVATPRPISRFDALVIIAVGPTDQDVCRDPIEIGLGFLVQQVGDHSDGTDPLVVAVFHDRGDVCTPLSPCRILLSEDQVTGRLGADEHVKVGEVGPAPKRLVDDRAKRCNPQSTPDDRQHPAIQVVDRPGSPERTSRR